MSKRELGVVSVFNEEVLSEVDGFLESIQDTYDVDCQPLYQLDEILSDVGVSPSEFLAVLDGALSEEVELSDDSVCENKLVS